jgi:hypothetical protein
MTPLDGGSTRPSTQPFGKTTVSGSATTPFQFTGRENDGTELYCYGSSA